ncbi:hypothetical protein E4T56_gene7943 [Termitomyces sp. T112]|nr:hypothetical protein E4T56_gene7943 [Termitomyces sp. T112]KAH0583183.1 hypothetical protein H2248_011067 [Termitomyces sp. 'cryptogamus']KNZ74966.1 hypothetical protein J132_05365 [Termitomyces sp. J132]
MATYSAFFSSGFLASRNAHDTSSLGLSSDSDTEPDTDRESTPTPDNISRAVPVPAAPQSRLRKRRSSLTIGTSPMNAIRSPQRNASAALQLQMHLTSPSRSRSGSLSAAGTNNSNIASESTSLVGRMRSGSVGVALRPRRNVRRLAPVPAPAPPPTAPLPAVPAFFLSPAQPWFNAPLPKSSFLIPNHVETRAPLAVCPMPDQSSTFKGRQRGFSLSDGLTIDEEMKEN